MVLDNSTSKLASPAHSTEAHRLESKLGLKKVRIYYKREDLSPTGSHKVNTALAQAYYAAKEGKKILVTETGAGQWGTALAYAACLMGLSTVVFWVRAVYEWKSERGALMQMYGAKVYASPSLETSFGKRLLISNPKHSGSLGIAVSEGLEYADGSRERVYCLGSVLNHVLIHQSIIGLEAIKQFEYVDDSPDLVVASLGGGSNFGGIALPFMGEVLAGKRNCEFLAALPRSRDRDASHTVRRSSVSCCGAYHQLLEAQRTHSSSGLHNR
jgi:tryptophan synthase beta chain